MKKRLKTKVAVGVSALAITAMFTVTPIWANAAPFWGTDCEQFFGADGNEYQKCCKYKLWIRFGCKTRKTVDHTQ